jgi:hypothetical protein
MNGLNADSMPWERVEMLVKSLVDKSADEHGFVTRFEEHEVARELDKFFYKHYEGCKENSFRNTTMVRHDHAVLNKKEVQKALELTPTGIAVKTEPVNPNFKDFQQHLKVLKSGKMALGTQIEKGRDLLVLLEQAAVEVSSKARLAEFQKMMERSCSFLEQLRSSIVTCDKITATSSAEQLDDMTDESHESFLGFKITECLSHNDGLKQCIANNKAYL